MLNNRAGHLINQMKIFGVLVLLFTYLNTINCNKAAEQEEEYKAVYDLTTADGTSIDSDCANPEEPNSYTNPAYASIKDITMGAVKNGAAIDFRFFAPTASSVELLLYSSADLSYDQPTRTIAMTRDSNGWGLWERTGVTTAKTISDGGGYSYYRYRVNCMKPYSTADPMKESQRYIPDPYARANVGAGGHSIIIDPDWVTTGSGTFDGWTDTGTGTEWFGTGTPSRPKTHEYVIYETHIADFTGHYSSPAGSGVAPDDGELSIDPLSTKGAGKYLGFKEGISHLTTLGINAVELMPLHEAAVDNGNAEGYSWGYLPALFFAPESSYSSDAASGKQVLELKSLIDSLHANGIAVILDVVLNHTSNKYNYLFHADPNSRYYFRVDSAGNWENVGTGNKIYDDKTSRPFAYKLIMDNIKYWVEEYHIDGLRFDLAVGTQQSTLRDIQDMINGSASSSTTMSVTGGSTTTDNFGNSILLPNVMTAENWLGADRHSFMVQSDWTSPNFAAQISADYRGFMQWNDYYRESVKAFINGDTTAEVSNRTKDAVFFSKGRSDGVPNVTPKNPIDTVNYIESHDEATVANAVQGSKAKAALGALILLTSHGVPMLYEGQEFMHNKAIQDQSLEGNLLDWSLKNSNEDFYKFMSFLIKLRKGCPRFHAASDPASYSGHNSVGNQMYNLYINETNDACSSSVAPTANNTYWAILVNASASYQSMSITGSGWKAIVAVNGKCGDDYGADLFWYGGDDNDPATSTSDANEINGWGTGADSWGLNCRSAVILAKD